MIKKHKTNFKYLSIITCCIALIACNGSGSSNNGNNGNLQISNVTPDVTFGESQAITVSLDNYTLTQNVAVSVSLSNNKATIAPANCILNASNQNCQFTVTANMTGSDGVGDVQLTAISTNQPQLKESNVIIVVNKPNYIAFSGANELYSYDGKNWLLKESTGFVINSVALAKDVFSLSSSRNYVAVGQTGNGNNSVPHNPLVITSDDGINWSTINEVVSESDSVTHLFNLNEVNGSVLTSGVDPSFSRPLSNYFGGYYESNGVTYSFGGHINYNGYSIVLSQQYESANVKMCFTSPQKYPSGSNVYYNNNIYSYFTNAESSCTGTLGESNLNSYVRRNVTRSIFESIDTVPQLSTTYGIQNISTEQDGFITYGASNEFVSDGLRQNAYPTILLQDFPAVISPASATPIYIGAGTDYESKFKGNVITAFSAVPTHSDTYLPYVGFVSTTTGLKPYVFTINSDGSNQKIKVLSINGDSSYFYAIQVVPSFLGDAFTVIGVGTSGNITILNSTDGLNWQPANVPAVAADRGHTTIAR